jgi:hypothetical protein
MAGKLSATGLRQCATTAERIVRPVTDPGLRGVAYGLVLRELLDNECTDDLED